MPLMAYPTINAYKVSMNSKSYVVSQTANSEDYGRIAIEV